MTAEPKPRPKRRPWLQVHLSTCVVLMFVAGGLLWANVREREWIGPEMTLMPSGGASAASTSPEDTITDVHWICRGFGWPLPFLEWYPNVQMYELSRQLGHHVWNSVGSSWSLSFLPLAADVALAVAVLALAGFLCEWPIRRRQRAG